MTAATYDPSTTPMNQAAVRCGLRVKRWGSSHITVCLVDDVTGERVFEGQRWPDAWQFMRSRGLVASDYPDGHQGAEQ